MRHHRKDCDSEVKIKGWPSITAFRVWRIDFKKAVAANSRRARLAYAWITEVESAKCIADLEDTGDFGELDMKLSKALDDIIQGEFKKKVQVQETELSTKGLLLNGRQITWMLHDYQGL